MTGGEGAQNEPINPKFVFRLFLRCEAVLRDLSNLPLHYIKDSRRSFPCSRVRPGLIFLNLTSLPCSSLVHVSLQDVVATRKQELLLT